jgi:hypothetical protein
MLTTKSSARFFPLFELKSFFSGVDFSVNSILRTTVIALAALVLGGCVTPQINWQARIGNYTYDQAVMDYGPPDRTTKLSDGSSVNEWLIQRGAVIVEPEPIFYGRHYFGPAWPGCSTTYYPARFLRLTFGPDGKLKAEKEFSK